MARHQNGLSPWKLLFASPSSCIIYKLIVFTLCPTFCEDNFLPSIILIGFKQLACIHHSIEGQMSKLVDSNNGINTAYLREVRN